ncbi:MAG TPA: protein kinase [Polyangiaceae bacterium]|nr:protein kinase [Polyangiaceae bacterium]
MSVPSATARAASLPRHFERWTLMKQIARGGMGEVFLATTGGIEGAERPCVVKIIRREHAADKSFLARFLDEARIQAQLQHPGVAQILEASSDDSGKPYVVVEYVEGRNLAEVRARATQLKLTIGWPEAVAVAVAMAEALAHIHERTDASGRPLSIVHRDLSPQNVMIAYAGDIKLIDFGTARGENRRCHTIAGIVFAKPGYVAPEVANNTPGGVPADLYAFGIMLWELLAGKRFLTGEAREHMALVGKGERNPPAIAAELCAPHDLDRVIARLTAARIEDRYVSARQAAAELIDVLKSAPSLAEGERGVRTRVARLMQRLYPAEPGRSRVEFAELVRAARKLCPRSEPSVAVPPEPLPDGMLAGTRYRLTREVGRGGMGVVFEGVHIDLGRAVAIKVLPREHAQSATFDERFRAEARAIANLQHDNLVRLYDFGISADGQPFYAMERLEGEGVDARLEREQCLPWRAAFELGVQACRALEAAHSAGVVHRDIKPGNLYLTRSGTLKLLDFGIAKHVAGADGRERTRTPAGNEVSGTPEYMAPEQVSGEPADERCDVYALGVVLYELVTGSLPHQAQSTDLLLDAKLQTLPERPGQRAPKRGLTHMVDDTLLRSLERDPSQRFQSAAEMREALEVALREPERRRRQRRAFGFALLGMLAIAIGAVTAVASTQPHVRARALAVAAPVLDRLQGLGRAPQAEKAALANIAPAAELAPESAATGGQSAPASEQGAAAADDGDGTADDTAEPAEVADLDADEAEPAADGEESPAALSKATAGEASEKDADDDEAGAESSADTTKENPRDKLEEQIAAAQQLMEGGKRIKGFNQLRRIGRNNGKDARALKAWSEAAAHMKGWGEAIRVATQWAEFDKSSEAQLHLARMQRATGRRSEAIRTLSRLTKKDPSCEEARELLKSYSGDTRVALQQ